MGERPRARSRIFRSRAREKAERRTDADLKDPLDTQRNRIRVITVDGGAVGTLWYSFSAGKAFVDDITIADACRGNGYGQRALELMKQRSTSWQPGGREP